MSDTPDEMTLELKKPLKTKADDVVTELKLREPTAAQWREFDKLPGVESDIMAVAKVTGYPVDVIGQMAASDLVKATGFLAGFFGPAPTTGAKP